MSIFSFFGKGSAAPAVEVVDTPHLPAETLGEFSRHFPIGARVHYYPEFQRNIKLDSIILGYQVNSHFVYSDHDLHVQPGAGPTPVSVIDGGRVVPVPRVEQFHFLVPFKTRNEMDYSPSSGTSLEETFTEKAVNDFKRNNAITLFNMGANGKVPHLDSTVRRVQEMRDGVYANRRVVMLEPDPQSFQFLDQRQYHRVYTRIPVHVGRDLESAAETSVLLDFSERFLRISLDPEMDWAKLPEGAKLYVRIVVEQRSEPFLLQGTLYRKGEEYAVISLVAICKQQRFQNLDLIDELDLKTSLLHHPETLRVQAEDRQPD